VKITVLGSGSAGNCTLVEAADVRLLIDAGFSGRDLERRLATVAVDPCSISALLITHDHGDHTRGMGVIARRWRIPVYVTEPTHTACARLLDGSEDVRMYRSDESVEIGGLTVDPFLTVHDAVDPVAVTVTERATGEKLGIATDLGRPTEGMRHALRECDLLILEANHDEVMLRESPYPWAVKARIGGSHGHLSNRVAAELVAELHHTGLCTVVLAHLSENSNDPRLAHDEVRRALKRVRYRGTLHVARQHTPLEPIDLAALRRMRQPAQLSLL
jgi:phosphoribosyl 1,2-cyclic phosphodiesterase